MTQDHSYPDHPGHKAAGPSQDAADAIAPRAPRIRDRVLQTITAAPSPMTADEIAGALGMSILTIRPRVSELHRMGEIRRGSDRRCNSSGMSAGTWCAAPALPNDINTNRG